MHGAPSVTYPVGRSALLGLLLGLAWLAGALACAAWAWQVGSAARQATALAATALAGGWVSRWWWRHPAGRLAWNGGDWTWSPGGLGAVAAAGRVHPALDLQSALLLRWHAPGQRTTWLWAERSRLPGRWAALRRAVYSRADAGVLPGAKPPSART